MVNLSFYDDVHILEFPNDPDFDIFVMTFGMF